MGRIVKGQAFLGTGIYSSSLILRTFFFSCFVLSIENLAKVKGLDLYQRLTKQYLLLNELQSFVK